MQPLIPAAAREALKDRLARRPRPRWGNLRRAAPFSTDYGLDRRGTPVDRVYIEEFLERHAGAIRGRVLEIEGPHYARRFGGDRVEVAEVLDVDPANADATYVGDLCEAGVVPAGRFDCFVLTQTLQYVVDPQAALRNACAALAPGGVLLLTVPAIARVEAFYPDRWRWTPAGLATLAGSACAAAEVAVEGFGNALAAVAFVMGLTAEELRREELAVRDPALPIVVCARISVPGAP